VCDQYTLQGDASSRAILGETPLEFPIEDALANMRVIDALIRSAAQGSWETPSAPTLTLGEGSAAQHSSARHSPDCFTRLFSLFAPCFSLLSPFFSLFRGDSGLDNPSKTVCFQRVDQKAPSRSNSQAVG
jgi:hypothetical protein